MRWRLLTLPVLALVAAGVIWWRQEPVGPAATWRVGAGTDFHQAENFEALAPETPIRVSLHTGAPTYVYVFSHSREDGTLLLWPSPELKAGITTPVPAGQTVLPGQHDGRELAWTSRSGVRAGTTYVIAAAAAPIAQLEQLMPRLRRWSNSVFPDATMVVTRPATGEITGGPDSREFADPLLQRAAERSRGEVVPNGPLEEDTELRGVFTGCWRFVEKAP